MDDFSAVKYVLKFFSKRIKVSENINEFAGIALIVRGCLFFIIIFKLKIKEERAARQLNEKIELIGN